VSSGTIYNCIAELRQALARDGDTLEYIETLPKKGYRLAPAIVAMPVKSAGRPGRNSMAVLPLVNRSNDAEIEYLCDGISDEILYGLTRTGGLKVYSAKSLKEQNLDVRVVGLRFGVQMVLSGTQFFGSMISPVAKRSGRAVMIMRCAICSNYRTPLQDK
jgi:hypothetical protein